MLRTVGKILLLRVLPRRIVPLYAAWEAFRFLRGRGGRDGRDDGRDEQGRRRSRGRFRR
jgi:hypothetical protein